jgi:hypothetical protein
MIPQGTETQDDAARTFTIKVEHSDEGMYRADFLGHKVTAKSLGLLMDSIKLVLSSVASRDAVDAKPDEEEDDAGFEQDLDRVLLKNAELYRRLAQ